MIEPDSFYWLSSTSTLLLQFSSNGRDAILRRAKRYLPSIPTALHRPALPPFASHRFTTAQLTISLWQHWLTYSAWGNNPSAERQRDCRPANRENASLFIRSGRTFYTSAWRRWRRITWHLGANSWSQSPALNWSQPLGRESVGLASINRAPLRVCLTAPTTASQPHRSGDLASKRRSSLWPCIVQLQYHWFVGRLQFRRSVIDETWWIYISRATASIWPVWDGDRIWAPAAKSCTVYTTRYKSIQGRAWEIHWLLAW